MPITNHLIFSAWPEMASWLNHWWKNCFAHRTTHILLCLQVAKQMFHPTVEPLFQPLLTSIVVDLFPLFPYNAKLYICTCSHHDDDQNETFLQFNCWQHTRHRHSTTTSPLSMHTSWHIDSTMFIKLINGKNKDQLWRNVAVDQLWSLVMTEPHCV